MIGASRFIASKGLNEEAWLEARKRGVTATQVARAATPSGFDAELASWSDPRPIEDNAVMVFGREAEPRISLWLKDRFDVLPTDWVIAHEYEERFLASPDGLSVDHSRVVEIKTTGKPWEDYRSAPIHYRRQIQWQLFVTGAEACVFAWMLRADLGESFADGWFEPRVVIVERDSVMIDALVDVANRLLEARDSLELEWMTASA